MSSDAGCDVKREAAAGLGREAEEVKYNSRDLSMMATEEEVLSSIRTKHRHVS